MVNLDICQSFSYYAYAMTEKEIVRDLKERVKLSGLRPIANQLGITIQYLWDLVHNNRKLGPKILRSLGLTKKITYKKVSK